MNHSITIATLTNCIFLISVKSDGRVIATGTTSNPSPYLPALGLPPRALTDFEKPTIKLSAFISEHAAFAVTALLDAERSYPEDFMGYGERTSENPALSLTAYAKLVFKGALIAKKNASNWEKRDIFRRYIIPEKVFISWRAEVQQGKTPPKRHHDIPWHLIIRKSAEESSPSPLEIQLDANTVQSTTAHYLFPLMKTLGVPLENFDDWSEQTIHIPLPQHRALPLICLLEHMKCIEQTDPSDEWESACEYLIKGVTFNQDPYWSFRQALNITDNALGQKSYDYPFAPYRYDVGDDLLYKIESIT